MLNVKGLQKLQEELSKSLCPLDSLPTKKSPREKYQHITTFYDGQSYRVNACSDSILGDLQLTIKIPEGNFFMKITEMDLKHSTLKLIYSTTYHNIKGT